MVENYKLYLFKEKNLKIKKLDIYEFFLQYQEVTAARIENDSIMKLTYFDPSIDCKFNIYICEKLMVPDIYKLDPKYLSLSSYIEIPITTPDFSAGIIFDIVKNLTCRLTIALYNEMFENVITFRENVVKTAFAKYKALYKKDAQHKYNAFYQMDKIKLEECLKYQRQQYELQIFYKEENIKVPKYLFLQSNYRPYVACEWNVNDQMVFPPRLDMIYYITEEEYALYYARDFFEVVKGYLSNVQGCIGASMITTKYIKKVKKAIKKAKLVPVDLQLDPIRLNEIIDF